MPSFARFLTLAGVFAASALSSGCLESNATLPMTDAGTTQTSGDGSVTVFNTDTGAKVDAHLGVDATMPGTDTGVPDTGTGVVIPSCTGATPAAMACTQCDETKCATESTTLVSACASFYTCYAACACTDAACISACEMAVTASACISAVKAIGTCQAASCATPCATDAGITSGDASAPTGDAGATCMNPTATQKACAACEESKCASTVAASKSACGTFDACFDKCDCSDSTCVDTCYEAAPQSCQTGTCATECSGSDAGTTAGKDGGASGATLPLCKNASSTIMACAVCDDKECQSEVAAANAACVTYNACYTTTDCTDVATGACATDATNACDTAAEALADCQDSLCIESCG